MSDSWADLIDVSDGHPPPEKPVEITVTLNSKEVEEAIRVYIEEYKELSIPADLDFDAVYGLKNVQVVYKHKK